LKKVQKPRKNTINTPKYRALQIGESYFKMLKGEK